MKTIQINFITVMLAGFFVLFSGANTVLSQGLPGKSLNKSSNDSAEFAKFCAKFTLVTLPFPSENNRSIDTTSKWAPDTIPFSMVTKFLSKDNSGHFKSDNTDDSGFYYESTVRFPDKGNYIIVEYLEVEHGNNYTLASFTPQGKLVDKMLAGRVFFRDYQISSSIDRDYTIHTAKINIAEGGVPSRERSDSLLFKVKNTMYRIDSNGKFKKVSEKESFDWYINAEDQIYFKAHIKK